MDASIALMRANGVSVDSIRFVDHDVATPGTTASATASCRIPNTGEARGILGVLSYSKQLTRVKS
jgi:hypothetical protein